MPGGGPCLPRMEPIAATGCAGVRRAASQPRRRQLHVEPSTPQMSHGAAGPNAWHRSIWCRSSDVLEATRVDAESTWRGPAVVATSVGATLPRISQATSQVAAIIVANTGRAKRRMGARYRRAHGAAGTRGLLGETFIAFMRKLSIVGGRGPQSSLRRGRRGRRFDGRMPCGLRGRHRRSLGRRRHLPLRHRRQRRHHRRIRRAQRMFAQMSGGQSTARGRCWEPAMPSAAPALAPLPPCPLDAPRPPV